MYKWHRLFSGLHYYCYARPVIVAGNGDETGNYIVAPVGIG